MIFCHFLFRQVKYFLLALGILFPFGGDTQNLYGFQTYRENDKYGIRFHGAVCVYPQYDSLIVAPYSNRIAGGYQQNGKWGILVNGTRITPPVFEAVSGGLNRLMNEQKFFTLGIKEPFFIMAVKDQGKWGYVDALGNYIIEPQYDKVSDFRNGYPDPSYHYAMVQKGNSLYYIDLLNQAVSEDISDIVPNGILRPKGGPALGKSREKAAKAVQKDKANAGKRKEMIAHLKGQYEKAQISPALTEESQAKKIQEGDRWLIVSTNGQAVTPELYDDAMEQESGVFRVIRANRYGLVDACKGEIVPCMYDYITEFEEDGRAEVWNAGITGHISKHGHVTIEEDLINEAQKKRGQEQIKAYQQLAEYNPYNPVVFTRLGNAYYDLGAFADSYQAYDYGFKLAKEQGIEKAVRDHLFAGTTRDRAYNQAHGIQTPQRQSGWDLMINLVNQSMEVYNSIQNIKHGGQGQSGLSSGGGTGSGGGSYEAQYRRWENLAERHYNSLTNTGIRVTSNGQHSGKAGSMSGGNYVQQKKAFREAQREMANLRTKAARNGVNIPQSKWETATVN